VSTFDNDDGWVEQLRREELRRQIEGKAPASIGTATSSTISSGFGPPKIAGLTRTQVVDGIQVTWTDPGIRDLAFYEVQRSTTNTFVNPTSVRVRQEQHIFRDLDPDTTYFIRVRAQNQAGNLGPFSNSVNTTTGTVQASEIAVGATQTIHEVSQSGSPIFNLATNGATNNTDDLTFTVFDANTIIIPRSIIQLDYASAWGASSTTNNLTVELREDTGSGFSTVDSAQIDFKSTVPSSGASKARVTLPSFTSFRQPGGGSITYDIKLTTNIAGAASGLDIDFLNIKLQFLQIKR